MLKNFFSRFFKKTEHQKQNSVVVMFDGDNANKKFLSAFQVKKNVSYHWIGCSSIPAPITKMGAKIHVPPNIGKESTDMSIAMLAMQECVVNQDLRELHLVSNDGDMIEIMLVLSKKFPTIKFFMIYTGVGPATSKKALNAMKSLPSNVSCAKIKVS